MKDIEAHKKAFVSLSFVWQIVMVVLYVTTTEYASGVGNSTESGENAGDVQQYYPLYQDVHVMVFVGFGFLMTFLKKYGHSAVGFNFLISALAIQWGILMHGYWHQVWEDSDWHDIQLDIVSLIRADFAAATVMITFGALLGKTSPLQLLIIMIIEIVLVTLNEEIGAVELNAVDMGGSMFVHTFGAYFGLGVSYALTRPAKDESVIRKNGATNNSDLFAMIGTLFLWMFWPSFNGALAGPTQQHRVVINTVLALTASCSTAYYVDAVARGKKFKFNMVSVQNATLAGGVAVGSSSDLVIQPWGAIVCGIVAGAVSVIGYTHIQPYLQRKIGLDDTCGVHNLHGMPGIIGAIGGIISAARASDVEYGENIGVVFPARSPDAQGWSAAEQANHQLYTLLITLGISIVGGLLTGFFVKQIGHLDESVWYDDAHFWDQEEEEDERMLLPTDSPRTDLKQDDVQISKI